MLSIDQIMRQAVAPASANSADSPTPIVWGGFHMMRDDFKVICGSVHASNTLRGLETLHVEHVKQLRQRGLPLAQQPAEADAWFALPTLREFAEEWLHETASHSKSGSVLHLLKQLGYIEMRHIAYVDDRYSMPYARTYRDPSGKQYIVLDDARGNYTTLVGTQGKLPKEQAVRQCRYCDDQINQAIYLQAFLEPPTPPKRWKQLTQVWPAQAEADPPDKANSEPAPLTPIAGVGPAVKDASLQITATKQDVARGETHTTTQEPSTSKYTKQVQNSATLLPDSGTSISSFGNIGNVEQMSHAEQDRASVNAACFVSAPLTVSTLAERLSHILDMPAKTDKNAKWYWEKVEEPLEWIVKKFEEEAAKGVAYRYSWEDLAKRALWTHHAPFWTQSCKCPLPTNLVGRDKVTGQLTGHNWERMPGDWRNAGGFHPPIEVEYFGPDVVEAVADEDSYPAQNDQKPRQDEQETAVVVEEVQSSRETQDFDLGAKGGEEKADGPPPYALGPAIPFVELKGLSWEEMNELADEIRGAKANRGLRLGTDQFDDGSYMLAIEYAPDRWLKLRSFDAWRYAGPAAERMVREARKYAESLTSGQQGTDGTALVSHPHHSFLFLDDLLIPTTLTVYLTSEESELEDDRRQRIAQEVKWELATRGYHVEARYVREAGLEARV